MHQYRVTLGNRVTYHDTYPDWSKVFDYANERGYFVQLERRLVTKADPLWLDGLRDEQGNLPQGSMLLGDKYVSEWEVRADNKERFGVLIGQIQDQ